MTNCRKFVCIIFFLFIQGLSSTFGEISFRLGRSQGGNLRAPVGIYDELPEAHWFRQKLDHFAPTDLRIWKQVFIKKKKEPNKNLAIYYTNYYTI